MAAVQDAITMSGRCIRLTSRALDAIITSVMMPVMLMLVFVYLFGGAIKSSTGGDYVRYVVPGVLLLCAGWGGAATAVNVNMDMNGGIVDRLRSMDVGGTAVLAGHVVASVARNIVSTLIVFGVALLIGFRSDADVMGWLGAVGVLLMFMLAVSWLASVFGLLVQSAEAAGGFSFIMMFVPYVSSAFVPVSTLPSWLRGVAEHQPVTPVIESLRALLNDQPLGNSGWLALTWCAGILVVSAVLADVLFRKRVA
ncbi:multidrug efflux ABC transporter permease LieB [Streptomyces sp. KM77-8]|uniref:Transport permease protein n=1 Tax=Streptomyces haneummycinicus TaxID=3074435 RepID=A0AAT9HHC1_9ACTN